MFLGEKKIHEVKITPPKIPKMIQTDREYLKKLERTIASEDNDKVKSHILETVSNINEYIKQRELFWIYYE